MTATVAGIHLGIDTHANRPAADTVPDGSIYSCSDHGLLYKSNFAGNSWATYATLGGGTPGAHATSHEDGGADELEIVDLATAETDDTLVLAPDGAGGVEFRAESGGGSASIDTIYTYPQQADLTGDSTHFTVATGWADADTTFDAASIEGGSFYKLTASGTAQTSTKRFTLASAKAAAFTVDALIYPDFDYWSPSDTHFWLRLSNSGHSRIAEMRITPVSNTGGTNLRGYILTPFANGAVTGTAITGIFDKGEGVTVRIVRDGSNVLTFFYGIGAQPAVLHQMRLSTTNAPATMTQTGTVEEIDLSMTTVTGDAAAVYNAYVDYIRIA